MPKKRTPYGEIDADNLILRDHLAIDRTELANERTLMAYVRAALGLLVVGLSFLEFAESEWMHSFAYVAILLSVFVLFWGVRRFRHFRRDMLRRIPPGVQDE